LQATVIAPDALPTLPAAVEVAAYRIVQEALTNVARHAHAKTCTVSLAIAQDLEIEIGDDGIGIAPHRRAGVGLSSIGRERVKCGRRFLIVRINILALRNGHSIQCLWKNRPKSLVVSYENRSSAKGGTAHIHRL
jgi:signal transduction histidine kinase